VKNGLLRLVNMLRGYDYLGRLVGNGEICPNGKWRVVVGSVVITLVSEDQVKSALGVFGAVSFRNPELIQYDDDDYGLEIHGRGYT
jgi:hypothetical protein